MEPGTTTLQPLTEQAWELFEALVERHNGTFGGCRVWFHPECEGRERGYEGNRVFKRRLVAEGGAHAVGGRGSLDWAIVRGAE